MNILHSVFRPPFFSDAEKSRKAVMLHFILLFSILLDVFGGLGMFWASDLGIGGLVLNAVLGAGLFALLWLLYRGKVELTGILVCLVFWLAVTGMVAGDSGILNPVFSGYGVVIIVAGLTINEEAAIGYTILNSVTGLVLVYVAEHGSYLTEVGGSTARIAWIDYTCIFTLITLFLVLGLRVLRRAYARLSSSEERFRTLIEKSSDLIVICGWDSTIQFVSPSLESVMGYTPEDVIGQSGFSFIHPDDLAAVQTATINMAGEPSGRRLAEIRVRHKDGSYRVLEAVARNMLQIPSVGGIVVNARDVTERVETAAALRRSEELFAKVFEAVPIAIGISTIREGRLVKINPYALAMSGYKADELLGRTTSEITIWPSPLRSIPEVAKTLQETGSVRDIESVWTTKSGEKREVLISLQPIEVNNEACLLTIALDLTERNRLEKQQLEAERMRLQVYKEREVLELKERFISNVSHEFRTPLTVILAAKGALERYYDRMPPDRRQQHFQMIEDQVVFVTQLLDDVLTIGKARSGKLAFNPIRLNLATFCRKFFEQMEMTDDGRHTFIFSDDVQVEEILGDEHLLQHILVNLLSNAIKYSPEGGEIRLELKQEADAAVMQISDQGIGIPEADQAHLFEPFQRASNTGSIKGTGLGLAIVKESVEAHGGSIRCDSEVGRGTRFCIHLPLKRSA